jgi:hypothetical protein
MMILMQREFDTRKEQGVMLQDLDTPNLGKAVWGDRNRQFSQKSEPRLSRSQPSQLNELFDFG